MLPAQKISYGFEVEEIMFYSVNLLFKSLHSVPSNNESSLKK